ncbi:MAG: nicotinate (nicotinamide) nucleotide adenylyltransferase [Fermentimonas sp.]|nr:nicotinate (nicotinamide) nucleotide adenylyltransferase [Fermentimonas sp.]
MKDRCFKKEVSVFLFNMKKREIGIFSGSFNPIHYGHLILASYLSEFTYLEQVWFVVTPHNPLKDSAVLIDDGARLQMVKMAVEGYDRLLASDVEFNMPRPSFTVNTLKNLSEKYADVNFTLIIGADNWAVFDRWKNASEIINNYKILIYPRLGVEIVIPEIYSLTVHEVDAPVIEVSSTFIRKSISEGKNMQAFVPAKVYEFIKANRLYLLSETSES